VELFVRAFLGRSGTLDFFKDSFGFGARRTISERVVLSNAASDRWLEFAERDDDVQAICPCDSPGAEQSRDSSNIAKC
jgi:hypothetical protein